MVEIVNVVASGSLSNEIDLDHVASDIGGPLAQYDPEKHPGMYIRFTNDEPLITVYRTGKYIITGANSEEELFSLRERFLNHFSARKVIEEPQDEWFAIQNYVCTSELGQKVDLNKLAIGLGLEMTEYEPEQFPGLIYRPHSEDCVVLIFGTGKVILTGAKDMQTVEATFENLQKELLDLL